MGKRSLPPLLLLLLALGAGAELPRFDLSKMDPVLGGWFELARAQAESLLADDEVPAASKAAAIGSLGQTYYAFDLFEPALTCLELARDLAPEDARWHYLTGSIASTLGRSELAREALERAAATDDPPLAVLIGLADLHVAEGRPEPALPLYRRAIELEGGAAIGHLGAGRTLAQLGRPEEAVPHFTAALEAQPDASAVHYPLARALLALDRSAEAQRHLARRGERGVRYPNPFLDEISDVKALVAFQVVHSMAAEQETRPPEHILRFALTYLGSLEGTVEAFEGVMSRPDLQAAPARQRAILHYVVGGIALRQGLDASAHEHLEQAVTADPTLVEPRALLGNQLAREGDFAGAAEQFSAALEQRQDDEELLLKRATALLNANRTAEARRDLERILATRPDDLQASIRLAQVVEVEGRPADADARLAELVNGFPDGEDRLAVERAWAELERRRGDLTAAIEHLRAGLDAMPSDPAARLDLARMLGGIGDFARAEQEFARVLAAWPGHPGALQGRVTALILLERYGAAAAILEEAMQQPGTAPELQTVLVRVLAAAPDPDVRKPQRAIELARELAAGLDDPLIIDSLAMAEAAVGNFPRAVELQQEVVTRAGALAGASTRLEHYRRDRPFVAARPEELLPPAP